MAEKKFNLFIYGSLRDRRIFKSVCGLSFSLKLPHIKKDILLAEPALLAGYKRVSPDNVYYYGVKSHSFKNRRTRYLRCSRKRQWRKSINTRVNVLKGKPSASIPPQALFVRNTYLVSRESMKKLFGDRWHVNLIHELWLRKRIEKFLKKRTRPGERSKDAELERIADRELLATTESDLVISHYRTDAISDYFLEHELDRPRPSIKHLYTDRHAFPFIKNYLALVIKAGPAQSARRKIPVQIPL